MHSVDKKNTSFQWSWYYAFIIYLGLTLVLSSGCSRLEIPVRDGYYVDNSNPGHYRVRPGDTLYSIAWHLDRDYQGLAEVNGIRPPYSIYSGQILQLAHQSHKKPSTPHTAKHSSSQVSTRQVTHSKVGSATSKAHVQKTINWRWPANGKLISRFSNKGVGNKGVDIQGKQGDPVRTAAKGVVVYRGDALLGYGKIIIIKHSEQYLSAYAHNSKIIVKEGQWVKADQLIAKIGSSGTDKNKLHFEIRREGMPVDPLNYLPALK